MNTFSTGFKYQIGASVAQLVVGAILLAPLGYLFYKIRQEELKEEAAKIAASKEE